MPKTAKPAIRETQSTSTGGGFYLNADLFNSAEVYLGNYQGNIELLKNNVASYTCFSKGNINKKFNELVKKYYDIFSELEDIFKDYYEKTSGIINLMDQTRISISYYNADYAAAFGYDYENLKASIDAQIEYEKKVSRMQELYANIEDLKKQIDDLGPEPYTGQYSYSPKHEEWFSKKAPLDRAIREAEAEIEQIQKDLGIYENKWYEDWGEAFSSCATAWKDGVSLLINEGDFSGIGEAFKETGCTVLVVGDSILAGGEKVLEYIGDGTSMLNAGIIAGATWLVYDSWHEGNSASKAILDNALDEVRIDKVGDARRYFYENTKIGNWINDNSALKYDSAGAQAFQDAGIKTIEIAAAAVLTYFTGGAAAPFVTMGIGFLEGMGQEGEKLTRQVDREAGEEYNYGKIYLKSGAKAVGKAAEWYGYGKMGANLFNPSVGANPTTSFWQNFGNNLKEDALDMALDTAATVSDDVVSAVVGDKTWGEAFKGMLTDLSISTVLNLGGDALSAYKGTKNAKSLMADDLIDEERTAARYADIEALWGDGADVELVTPNSLFDALTDEERTAARYADVVALWGDGADVELLEITPKLHYDPMAELDNIAMNDLLDEQARIDDAIAVWGGKEDVSLLTTKLEFDVTGDVESQFRINANKIGYLDESIDAYVEQIKKDAEWDTIKSLKELDEGQFYIATGVNKSDFLSKNYSEQCAIASTTKEYADKINLSYDNSYQVLQQTKTNCLNGWYECSESDVITARMNAKNGVYTPSKKVIINDVDYSYVFPQCDDFITNERLYENTLEMLEKTGVTEDTILKYGTSIGVDSSDKLLCMGEYLKNNEVSVKVTTYQSAVQGSSNLVSFGSIGNQTQIYEINTSSGIVTKGLLYDDSSQLFYYKDRDGSKIFVNNNDINFEKRYNVSGGMYALTSSDIEMVESYPDCCHIENGKLVVDDYKLFGYKALSGVPLDKNAGVYKIESYIPVEQLSIPSVNNGTMYTAFGVPGGKLLSGKGETVVHGISLVEGDIEFHNGWGNNKWIDDINKTSYNGDVYKVSLLTK